MRKYIIERDMAGVGKSTDAELKGASAKSNQALAEIGRGIQWQSSYVAGDKIYCVYLADSEQVIRQHSKLSGFPADRITEVRAVLDPSSAGA
jgi:hypothetical protein